MARFNHTGIPSTAVDSILSIDDTLENGVLDIMLQDQTSDIVDYFFCRTLFPLALSETAIMDSYELKVVDATNVVVGTYVCVQENRRAFQAQVLSKVGNSLFLDSMIDYPFTTSCIIENRSPNLNVNGSVTPVVANLKPIPGVKWDITRIIFAMTHSAQADDGKFGGIPALSKGTILRKSDGVHHTLFNTKSNGDIRLRMYDLSYTDNAPAGLYGTSGMRVFGGQENNGVVIRLDGDNNDRLDIVIQDDLTGLTSFRVVAQGHIVEE